MRYLNCDKLLPCPKDIPFGYVFDEYNRLISYKAEKEYYDTNGILRHLQDCDIWWEIYEYDEDGNLIYLSNAAGGIYTK